MSEVTRREILGAAAFGAASGLLAGQVASAEAAQPAASRGPASQHARPLTAKFRLVDAPKQQFDGGTIQVADVDSFPISEQFAGVLMKLEPGAMREPHWHPNCVEWDYVLSGRLRYNVVPPHAPGETFEATAGDVVYFSQGYAHYFENIGGTEAAILIVFNAGRFQEIGITDWVAKAPKDAFTGPLSLPANGLANAPDHGLFITSKKAR